LQIDDKLEFGRQQHRQIGGCMSSVDIGCPLELLGLQPTKLLPPPIIRHLAHADLADCVHYVLACETRTSTCRSFATISSGLYRFLAIIVLLDVKDIPQVGPLQWGRINGAIEQKKPEAQSIDFWAMPKLSHFHQKTSKITDHR